jgi:hypothetical protein
MIDLLLADLGPEAARRFAQLIGEAVVEEGRAAYRAGIRYADVPPFVDDDMTASWRIGWRWERDLQNANRKT